MPHEFLDVREFINPSPESAQAQSGISTPSLLSILQLLDKAGSREVKPKGDPNKDMSAEIGMARLANNARGISKPPPKDKPNQLPYSPPDDLARYIQLLSQDRRNQQQTNFDPKGDMVNSTAVDPLAPTKQTDSGSMEMLTALITALGGGKAILPVIRALGLTTPKGLAANAALQVAGPLAKAGIEKSGEYLSDPQNALSRGFAELAKNPPSPR